MRARFLLIWLLRSRCAVCFEGSLLFMGSMCYHNSACICSYVDRCKSLAYLSSDAPVQCCWLFQTPLCFLHNDLPKNTFKQYVFWCYAVLLCYTWTYHIHAMLMRTHIAIDQLTPRYNMHTWQANKHTTTYMISEKHILRCSGICGHIGSHMVSDEKPVLLLKRSMFP